jgi:hypothetical protein
MATTARAPCTITPTLIPSWFSVSRDEAAAACSTSSGSVHVTLPSSPRFCRVCAAHPQLPRPNTGNKACPSLLRASGLSSSASWEGRSHLVHLLSSLRGLPISLSLSLSHPSCLCIVAATNAALYSSLCTQSQSLSGTLYLPLGRFFHCGLSLSQGGQTVQEICCCWTSASFIAGSRGTRSIGDRGGGFARIRPQGSCRGNNHVQFLLYSSLVPFVYSSSSCLLN